jgi:hypothetical protein
MGRDKEHKRFLLSHYGKVQTGVLFKTKRGFNLGEKVDIIYTINENHFNGRVTIQLMLEEVA